MRDKNGKFVKGTKPWNTDKSGWTIGTEAGFKKGNKLGKKFSKGHTLWKSPNAVKNQFKKGEIHHNLPHSEETKQKLTGFKRSEEFKEKLRGRKIPYNIRIKMSATKQNIDSVNWKGFVTSENKRIRRSMEYIIWRKAVFERDDYSCQCCKTKGCFLHPHHIKSFAKYPELRFDVNNGIALCVECHKLIHHFMINSMKGGFLKNEQKIWMAQWSSSC
jgi:hypothetical protein